MTREALNPDLTCGFDIHKHCNNQCKFFNVLVNRISRTERSGRYGSDQSRDESDWRDRRERDQERDHNMRRWGEERRSDRYEGGDRRGSRDSPEVFKYPVTINGFMMF